MEVPSSISRFRRRHSVPSALFSSVAVSRSAQPIFRRRGLPRCMHSRSQRSVGTMERLPASIEKKACVLYENHFSFNRDHAFLDIV